MIYTILYDNAIPFGSVVNMLQDRIKVHEYACKLRFNNGKGVIITPGTVKLLTSRGVELDFAHENECFAYALQYSNQLTLEDYGEYMDARAAN